MTLTNLDCDFCRDEIRLAAFAESDTCLAVYNLAPIVPGHSMVIPKRHFVSFLDMSDDDMCVLICFARTATRIVLEAFGSTGFDWSVQDSEEAGQTVPHAHLHVIPRKPLDLPSPGAWYGRLQSDIDSADRPRLTAEQMSEAVAALRAVVERSYPEVVVAQA